MTGTETANLNDGAVPLYAVRHVLPVTRQARPKILLYSHDTFGLGNIRRSLVLGDMLSHEYRQAAILLITGSPMIHAFQLPPRMDYVKLPCLNRVTAEQYTPRFLMDCAAEVTETRSQILERTAVAFSPDLLIVDKRAGGIGGELVPALQSLRALPRRPRIVLGMRDILDAPAATGAALRTNGSFDLIDRWYDEVWIYGSRLVFDAVAEYDFPPAVARKTRYCGYLRREAVTRCPPGDVPRVLVTTGGGEDGTRLVATYLQALDLVPARTIMSTIVLGPQLDAACAASLTAIAAGRDDVEIVSFEADMARRYAHASAVVSMAGYNTVCELLSARVPAVLVPRIAPVQEQLIRAQCLASRGLFQMIDPRALTPQTLLAHVRNALARPMQTARDIDLDGLTRIRMRVRRLLEGKV